MAESGGTLLVTRNFPPLRGGMERLNQRMLEVLGGLGRVALVGPRGSRRFVSSDVDVLEVPESPLWRFVAGLLPATLSMAWRRRPTVVIAGSGLTAPFAWIVARLFGAHCIVYLHGLDIVVPHRVYRMLWLPFIRRCDMAIVNSRNTGLLAMERGVSPSRVKVIHPGTDLPELHPQTAHSFRQQHGLMGRRVMLSVGRLTPRKGLPHFVREVLPRILAQCPDALLLVIGADATDALTADGRSERSRLLASAHEAGVERAVQLMPPCDDVTLSAAYQASDVHVFPVQDMPGDVEGFGMVAIEAAAHGLSTVAYAVGGVPDAVVAGRTGALVVAGNAVGFAEAVVRLMSLPDPEAARADCMLAARGFSWGRFSFQVGYLIQQELQAQ